MARNNLLTYPYLMKFLKLTLMLERYNSEQLLAIKEKLLLSTVEKLTMSNIGTQSQIEKY